MVQRTVEVPEMTRRLAIEAKSVISSSVIPSAKYSWAGSPGGQNLSRSLRVDLAMRHFCQPQTDATASTTTDPRAMKVFCSTTPDLPPAEAVAGGGKVARLVCSEAEPRSKVKTGVT